MNKYIKLGIWIFVLALLYAMGLFNIGGIYPELIFIFSLTYSVITKSFKERLFVSIICGIIMSALGGRGFIFSVLLIVYASLFIGAMYEKKPKYARIILLLSILLITMIYEGVYGLIIRASYDKIANIMIFASLSNLLFTAFLYPLIKKTFEEKERYIF